METKTPVSLSINGKSYEASTDQNLVDVIKENGIEIPHICYHQNLGTIQTCDTCMVEVNGQLVRSCATKAQSGMVVETKSLSAKAAQTEAMDRILENHLLYCTVCDNNNGDCRIHNTVEMMGIEHQSYPFSPKPYEVDMSHPFYRYDPTQCILCGQCVEACQNVQVNETLSINWELDRPRVIWDNDVNINESSCVSCGHCVNVCPCNALMEKSMLGEAGIMTNLKPELMAPMIELVKEVEPGYSGILAVSDLEATIRSTRTKKTKTVCTFCGVGCTFEVWTKGRKILKVQPTPDSPVNGISTCVKGKFGWDFVNSEDRLTKPLIRKGDTFVEATWEEAYALIASKMLGIKNRDGADALGFISSSKCTNEENYLMQKLARSVGGTNNVDNCSRYCQSPATTGLFRTVGYGGDAGSIYDMAGAGLGIIVGANPAEAHPVIATRLKRAQKKGTQKLIVADLRKNEMAERSDLFLRTNSGTDHVWLSSVTKYIIDKGWHDVAFLHEKVNGFADYAKSLEKYTLEYAEKVTGLSKEQLIQTATMIHEADGTAIFWAMGVTQHCGASETSTAISNLLLVTGNFARPNAGAFPLRGHNNVQGACDFGTLPNFFPGYELVTDDTVRARYEQAWGVTLPAEKGMDNPAMIEAIHEGRLKAMYIMGEEMAWVDANANYIHAALEKLEFLVVQDIFLTKTAQFADVILPASPSLEKEGTFTNTERRIQRLYQVLEPLKGTRPDWVILTEAANAMGADWQYNNPGEIMAEAASLAPLFAGVNYERLEGFKSLLWPVQADGTDTPILYLEKFPFPDGKARLFPTDWIPPVELPSEFDLLVNNGRLLEHFHEGNMTGKSDGINHKVPDTFVEISPELAKERGVKDGSLVRLESPYGAVKLRVLVTDRVRGKELYVPMNSTKEDSAVNLLTGNHHDLTTHTPAYKEAKVKMQVLNVEGDTPLPRINSRYGNRNPQTGVEVERKWSRADYKPLETVGREGK
ncbi:formate dehydrogenase major subunit [Aneurinibacillus soli]|uniref:Putative formate dehydrogenase n=1 Tax=Aneurinibacillus soli TaxID=1500254 RepID=A0A0U5B4R7_9BACL|nr:formate dehydrogenase subunit alpha [Aneurinibacillus soli]PYE57148.1 formate dehydrogenase major subunit [Aneurinibacillus soli]BAU25996.1 putative formate dehydrogenase [Aneurinibacillus soli]